MIKYLLIIIPILIAVSFFKFSCGDIDYIPEIKNISEFTIIELNRDSLSTNISVDIQNNNPIDIDLENTSLSFYYNGKPVGKTNIIQNIHLTSNSSTTVNIDVLFYTKKIVEIFEKNKDTVEFQLIGTTSSGFIFSKTVDINSSILIPVKSLFNKALSENIKNSSIISIDKAYIKNFGLSNTNVEVIFNFNNPFNLSVKAVKYPSDIYINGSLSGKGDFSAPILVKKKGSVSPGSAVYSISNLDALSSVFSTFLSGKLEYTIKGIIFIEIENIKLNFPFDYKGTLIKL